MLLDQSLKVTSKVATMCLNNVLVCDEVFLTLQGFFFGTIEIYYFAINISGAVRTSTHCFLPMHYLWDFRQSG